MASQVKVKTTGFDASKYGLDRDALIRIYRTMFLSRRMDDREIRLKRQNKISFRSAGAGQLAVLAAAGLLLKPGYDWSFPIYRDRALMLALGVTPYDMLLQAVGAADDPSSGQQADAVALGARQLDLPARGRWLRAVGAAEASLLSKLPKALGAGAQGAAGRFVELSPRRDRFRVGRRRIEQYGCCVPLGGGVAVGEVAERRFALHDDELLVVVDVEHGPGGVGHAPDDDRGDLDRVAARVVDLDPLALEVPDPQRDRLAPEDRERVHPPETGIGDGPGVATEQDQHPRLVRLHDHEPRAGERAREQHHDAHGLQRGAAAPAEGECRSDDEDHEVGDGGGGAGDGHGAPLVVDQALTRRRSRCLLLAVVV